MIFLTVAKRIMKFEDSIFIQAPCEKVFAFFEEMDQNYLNWHPEHQVFEWRKGKGLAVGNVFYFEEELNGKLMKKETYFTDIIPNRYIEFKMTKGLYRWFIPKLTFIMEPEGDGCVFTGQVFLQGFGPLAKWANRKDFAAVRQHMKEEGQNLKRILEGSLATETAKGALSSPL
ncbi:MAG TPA: SRPBCC family protein [Cytophagales bacterium]|nr:SRPBCC family protein [Cytophagales bacterium]HAP58805.1 SRPBCC family protein [Cytophagales bacterium]